MAGDVTGVAGVAANQLQRPYSLLFDSNNSLYIADSSNNRIQKWAKGAAAGVTVAGLANGTAGGSSPTLNISVGMALDESGNLYLTDRNNHRVIFWTKGASSGITIAGITGERDIES